MVTSIDWKYIEIILNKVEDGKKLYSEREFSYDHYLLIIQYVCVNDLKFQHSRSELVFMHQHLPWKAKLKSAEHTKKANDMLNLRVRAFQ